MKTIVLSDVHGNAFALETVLEDLKKTSYDQIVCNGDMIQSGVQPHETVQLLREMKCSIVMGNSDAWLMTGVETDAHLISEERRKDRRNCLSTPRLMVRFVSLAALRMKAKTYSMA